MPKPTILQQYKQMDIINRLRIVHEYYQAHPGCYVKDAVTFIPETVTMVAQYRKLYTECKVVISAVIDVRYNTEMPCAEIRGLEVVRNV